jgi:hypothetical protein
MEAGLSIRPSASVPETALLRSDPLPARTAVATTLAPGKSVTATVDSNRSSGHDAGHNALSQRQQQQQQRMSREVFIDPQSREVIFRVMDVRTGQVDYQMPDEALLRMRAYTRAMANGEAPLESEHNTYAEA